MNLGYSNTLWQAFWRRVLYHLRRYRLLREVRDTFRDRRTQVRNLMDVNANFAAIVLAGVIFGVNTAEDGKLSVRVSPNGGNWDVKLFKATGGGGGDEVARATNVAASGTGTLVAQNGSGMSGSVTLSGSVTAEATDVHFVRPYLDWRVDADATFDRTDAQGEDLKSLESISRANNDQEARLDDALEREVQLFREVMVGDPSQQNARGYGSKFLKEAFSSLLNEELVPDRQSGAVSRLRSGGLELLRKAMVDEATGSTQTVIRRLVAAAAGVAATGNDGQGTIAIHTPEAHCPTGVYTLRCVTGLGSNAGGVEEFEVSFASDEDDRTKVHTGRLRVGQAYQGEDGFGGSTFTILRTLTKTGDNSHVHLATVATGWTTSGERESNTSSGVLHWKIVQEGSTFVVEFYRTQAMQAGDLVARSIAAVAANTAFTAVQRNGSGLQITGTTGSSPVNGQTGTIDLNFFTPRNSTGAPDSFTVAVTLTSSGVISRLLAAMDLLNGNGFKLNGVASGAELIGDGLAKANTFEPFVVEDN